MRIEHGCGAIFFVVLAASNAACGSGGEGGSGAGDGAGAGNEGTGEGAWETYCEATLCAQRAAQAKAAGCDPDTACLDDCRARTQCRKELKAVVACAETGATECYPAGPGTTRVDIAPGTCLKEVNAMLRCLRGEPCDPNLDEGCGPVRCEGGTVAAMCVLGECVTDAAVICGSPVCTEGDSMKEDCPTAFCPTGPKAGGCVSSKCVLTCE